MKIYSFLAAFSFAFACSANWSLAAARWPQFRGPNGQGVAETGQPPIRFSPTTNLLWKAIVPSGVSSVCVWDERIFLTAFDKERKKLETLCLDRKTGNILWRRDVSAEKIEKVHEISNPASSTPVTDGKAVYVYFGSYGLIAYDFQGTVLWQKPLPSAKTFRDFGTGTSPILIGDRLIVDMHLDQDAHLLAVRCRDGETLWKTPKPLFNGGWSTPIAWREGGEELVGILNAGKFTAHDLQTGAEHWWINGIPNQICATPAVGDGVLFLTGTGVLGERENIILPPPFSELLAKYDVNKDERLGTDEIPKDMLIADRKGSGAGDMTLRQMLGFNPAKVQSFNREEWEKAKESLVQFAQSDMMKTSALAVRTGGKGDVTATHVNWTESKSVPEVPSPLLYRNRLYYVKNGGVLTCRDAANGKAIYEERLDALGGYYASPVAANGNVYTASDRGVVTVVAASDAFRVLARNDLKETIMATPAIVESKLYIRTASHVFAFGTD